MRYLIILIILFSFFSCNSVEKNRQLIETKISAADLKKDVDYAYIKLQKFHPDLYWYISKNELDFKIDSLKNSITEPLTPNQFYFKFSPVITSIKQGHLKLNGLKRKYSKKEQRELKNKKALLSQLKYKIIDDKMFVVENKDSITNIALGTEILKIDNDNVSDLIKKYKRQFSSDGENKTFNKYFINLAFFNYFTLEKGFLDQVTLTIKNENNTEVITLVREKKAKEKEEKKTTENKIIKNQDYNEISKSYNRILKFYNDSTIAYIRIKTFSATHSASFYKESFKKIKKANSQYLILDIRDNLGGSLAEINTLYSYLTNKEFTLIKKPEMTSRTSTMHQNYFRNSNLLTSIIKAPAYPIFLIANYFLSSKKDETYTLNIFSAKKKQPKNDFFDGDIFVLTNGASFSASSILAAKLKYEKRALIIGEETGGAYNGTVAGVYNTIKLPNSKLTLPIGLLLIKPNIEYDNSKRGVIPSIEIEPEYSEKLDTKDKIFEYTVELIQQNDKNSD